MKYVSLFLFILLQQSVLAQTTAPANIIPSTQPSTQPSSLQTGREKMNANDYRGAIQAFESSLGSQKGKLKTREQVVLAHHIAFCWSKLDQPAKVREWIEKSYNSDFTDKTIRINRAKLDLKLQGTLVRGMKEMEKVLNEFGVEEDALNAFGYAISQAIKNSASRGDANKSADVYLRFNTQLEATRPGEKHWGSVWISQKEYDEKVNNQQWIRQENEYVRRLDDCMENYKESLRALKEAQREAQLEGRDRYGRVSAAQSDVNRAKRSVEKAQMQLDSHRASKVMPVFSFDSKFIEPAV